MHDLQLTTERVDLHFAVQSDFQPGDQNSLEVVATEPLHHQDHAGVVSETGLEDRQALANAAELHRSHFGDNGSHFAGRELRDGLDVAAVFIAEWRIRKQVLNRDEAFAFQRRSAAWADAFHIHQGGTKIHAGGYKP